MLFFLWNVLCGLFSLRDNFLDAATQKSWATLAIVHKWDWHIWALGAVFIALVASLEGCYRGHRHHIDKERDIHGQSIKAVKDAHESEYSTWLIKEKDYVGQIGQLTDRLEQLNREYNALKAKSEQVPIPEILLDYGVDSGG